MLRDTTFRWPSFSSTSSSRKRLQALARRVEQVRQKSPLLPMVDDENTHPTVDKGDVAFSAADNECCICLEPLHGLAYIDDCFHVFCFACIRQWYEQRARCPLCRTIIRGVVHNVTTKSFDIFTVV